MPDPVRYHAGKFPPAKLQWDRLISLIGPANRALARYDAMLHAIPNASVLLAPLITQEAVLSSRIEGTQATMGEVLRYEAGEDDHAVSAEKREDIEEILNYRIALRQAVELMETLPICNRLIRQVHATLMVGVRGDDKAPGEFRRSQNLIGIKGRPIEEARFIPIEPENLEDGMHLWEEYVNDDAEDILVQLAIVHAEFESLHPFLDGNGRIGRILIPLFLYSRRVLREPMFYLSEYLEEHRDEYHDRLRSVSSEDDWTGWCAFFLQAVKEQAERNQIKAERILRMYDSRKDWIVEQTHSQHAIRLLDFIFGNPVFTTTAFASHSELTEATARRLLKILRDEGVLAVLRQSSGRRPTLYAFGELINVTEGREIFPSNSES